MPKGSVPSSEKDAHHGAGHRARLRSRFLNNGVDSLADYELLELLLFQAIPRRDIKPLAKLLIAEFGTLAALLSAAPETLQKAGLSEGATASLKSVAAAALVLARAEVDERPVISSWSALLDYLHIAMAHEKTEQFRLLYLDRKNKLIRDEIVSAGTVDQTAVYPREVAKRAMDLSATAVILAHNHPSGDPKPSRGDIAMTRDLVAALEKLDIKVHDHVIIAKHGHASFKTLGLL